MSYVTYRAQPMVALGFTYPSTVFDYMKEVNEAVNSLDGDIIKQLVGLLPVFSFSDWNFFVNNTQSPDLLEEAPPTGWRDFFKEYSGVSRFTNSDKVYQRTGEFERRLIDFYDQFVAAGGKPSKERPVPGHVPPPEEERPWPKILKTVAVVGGIGLALYLLPSYLIQYQKLERKPKKKRHAS